MSDSDLDVALVVGMGAGVFLFFKGFRVYREYRVLEDTPEAPIRSIAMGLVHIHGKARGDHLVPSPVSKTPCFFYKVDIEKWKTNSKGGGSWAHYKADANGVPFYLEDSSGKVLVDAHRAEYDLIQTAKRETGRGLGSGLARLLSDRPDPALMTGARVTDDELISYAESAVSTGGGASVLGSLGQLAIGGGLNINLGGGGSSSRRYRFTECCILPDHWYDLTGTCVENPAPQDEHDRNMIRKGENEPTFLISWRAEKEIERALRNRAALSVFGGAALSVVCLGGLLFRLGWL
jgi:hypothetical protein